jgi:hypothetical protein
MTEFEKSRTDPVNAKKMKYLLYFIGLVFAMHIAYGRNLEDGIRRQISEVKESPTKENIMALASEIRSSYRYKYALTLGEYAATIEAQEALCKIPGHAQYFADEIERLIADPANIGSDFPERLWYLQETLPHLPSPESIRVLGSYLNDDRFAPLKGADNSGATGRSGLIATNALRWIGLRESENVIRAEKGSHYSDLNDLRKMRAWWEEIKSGRRHMGNHRHGKSPGRRAAEQRRSPDSRASSTSRQTTTSSTNFCNRNTT